jgi:hypothetical protein
MRTPKRNSGDSWETNGICARVSDDTILRRRILVQRKLRQG